VTLPSILARLRELPCLRGPFTELDAEDAVLVPCCGPSIYEVARQLAHCLAALASF
jgi:hypothetical protein